MLVKSTMIAHSLAGALAANTPPATTPGSIAAHPTTAASLEAERVLEIGEATWYHRQHAPNITASGERFNPMGMTAAHRFIPLGTIVRVTDQATGRSVLVRVNDREPPHGHRCIDLAEGAAVALGIQHQGWARVKISEVGNEAHADTEATEVAEVPDPVAPSASSPRRAAHRHHRAAAHTRH